MWTIWTFDNIENKRTFYRRGKDCTSLTEHATNWIKFGNKKMFPLTQEELKLNKDPT